MRKNLNIFFPNGASLTRDNYRQQKGFNRERRMSFGDEDKQSSMTCMKSERKETN